MKSKYRFLHSAIVLVTTIFLAGCSQEKRDKSIKADLTTKAKSEKDFAGVRFTVENGIVTLNGECNSEKSRSSVFTKVKGLYGVQDVVNNLKVAPVLLGTDELLKLAVDSVLKDYATVEAVTKDSIVLLQGKLEKDKLQPLTEAISTLKPRMVENRLTMK